jgi:hypothetical protein
MPYKWSNSFSCGHCFSTYGPTNSAASPECLTNDPIPSLTATATLRTALLALLLPLNALQMIQFLLLRPCYSTYDLLTLLLPLNALQMIQFLLLRPCYSTYDPINSAASAECLTNDPIPSLMATATLFTALLTLLLPLNALQRIQFLLLRPLLLYLRPY